MAAGKTYLYLGPEVGERRDAVGELRTRLASGSAAPIEEFSFYAGETAIAELVSQLRNGSLFCDARLVLLKSAETIKKKEDIELLCSYIEKPQEDTVLVLVSDDTSVDKRIEGALPKENKRVFWEMFENRKIEWISSFFKREGFRIDGDGIEAILELVENNTDALRRECGRLTLFLGKETPIGAEEVERCLARSRQESAFTLFAAIAEGNLAASLETARTLLAAKEAPVAVLAGLLWCFRRLADYVSLSDSGRLGDAELRRVGIASKKAQRDYAAGARIFDAAGVNRAISLIAEFDVLLRSSGAPLEDLLMDLLIYKLVGDSARGMAKSRYFEI